jgi:hypothetical protein
LQTVLRELVNTCWIEKVAMAIQRGNAMAVLTGYTAAIIRPNGKIES